MDCNPPGSSAHGDSLGKNTGVGCHAQLQGIFPTQGSNPCLLNWQAGSLLSEPLKWRWWLGGGRESITNCIITKFVLLHAYSYIQFSRRFCLTLCDPMDCSMPGFPVHHQLPGLTQTHVHWVGDLMPSNHLILCSPLLPPSMYPSIIPGSFPMSQFFTSGGQSTGFQLQHQSFQRIFRTDFL